MTKQRILVTFYDKYQMEESTLLEIYEPKEILQGHSATEQTFV